MRAAVSTCMNTILKMVALLSLVTSPFVIGCSINTDASPPDPPLHSASISTSQMRASFSAQAGDQNVKVYASVFGTDANGNTTKGIELDEGDYFTASIAGSAPTTLTEGAQEDSLSAIPYSATLPLATAAEDITIALVRGHGQVSAPKSTVHLPAPFTLTTTAPASIKARSSIPVHLTPAPDAILTLEATGSCIADDNNNDNLTAPTIDEEGNGIIDTNQIALTGSGTCEASLFLSYSDSSGSVDSAFKGALDLFGDADGLQKRAITVTFTN
jgi:hypothetical protein